MATTNLKKLSAMPDLLSGGHAACPGCAGPMVIRQMLLAAQQDDIKVAVCCATGCMEVSTTVYPNSAWRVPFIHNGFENSAATICGAEAAYVSLKKQGKIDEDIRFIAMGGDGGTYDIGLQSLSGALERGHNFTYICYDNEAYMNTGIQRSSGTPKGANTTTAPIGKVSTGKKQIKKDLTAIVEAHGIPYVAQASVFRPMDFMKKVQKAIAIEGPCFINIFAPCQRGWRHGPDQTVAVAREAWANCVWPIFEIENGVMKINAKPREKKPITDYLKMQGRYKHVLKPENAGLLAEIQSDIDTKWDKLLAREAWDKSKAAS
jgi:pyruvate ferredoxin oxidoreductase beta subunit